MNKYLVKLAFDTDYDNPDEYGIAANRSINGPMVHGMLSKALKDPHINVGIDGRDASGKDVSYNSHTNPAGVSKLLAHIRSRLPAKSKEQHNKDRTMDWDRGYTWSMGMKKNNPILDKIVGKENRWGEDIETKSDAILHYINKKYDT